MRILAIRGENLASLAEPFEIAFDTEPLAAAGLFAITGETGAGKSTILDALCLALYDEFPRVKAEGANEAIPDGDNAPLSATDPRTILRRGAGRGYAEVDFAARDGAVYRVRCELNRARGRAAGALQKRGRALWKLAPEGTVEAVASDIRTVKAEVERLTDLTCDQFRRTVLLAQGDFDAFLRADAKERAELLEKITGTEIYATLSRRAYERHREARDALQALERQRDGIGLMAPEARAEAQAALAALALRKQEENAAREAIEAALRRHEAIAAATVKRDAAGEALTLAQAAADALGAERARLAALERVEPLRGAWEKVGEAETACAEAEGGREPAAQARAAAQQATAEAEAQEASSRAALTEAEAAVTALEPAWAEADACDRRLADAREAESRLAQARDEARRAAEATSAAAQDLAARVTAAEAETAKIAEGLARDAALEPLATRFAELSDALARRAGFVRDAAAHRAERDAAQATLQRLAAARATLDEADARDGETRAACDGRIAERLAALEALGAPATQARADGFEAADGLLARLAAAAEKAQAATRSRDEATARREAAAAAYAQARDAARAAQAEIDGLDARADEVARLGALAEATASEQARRLRAALVPGEPCPVCGVPHAPDHLSEPDAFVAEIRARGDALRREQDAARARLAEAKASGAAAERTGKEAAVAIAAETERLAAAETAYGEAHAAWRALPDLGLAAPPEVWREAGPALASLAGEIATARAAARETLRSADVLRQDIEAERARRDAAGAAIEGRRGERAALDRDASAAREAIARADARVPELEDRWASVDREWGRVLAAAGIAPEDLDRDAEAARRVLETRGRDYRGRAERRTALEQDLARDRPAASAAQARAEAAAATAAKAAADAVEAGEAAARLAEARAGLLGGEATDVHRSRHVDAAKSARAAFDAAREAGETARNRLAGAQAADEGAEAARAKAASRLAEAEAAFAAALAARGLPREEALALLAVAPEEREALRAGLAQADEAVREAASTLKHCETALADALAAGAPEEDATALAEHRAALVESLAALAEEEVARRVALEQDDRAREIAGRLEAEIAAAAAVAGLWAQMNDAIGSADGSKFRRYAQSVTLDHLVALANRHLEALSPRYRLERAGGEGGDLGLQIRDRDLGDERRSTRSLSGGERFLTSLALALALCSLEGRGSFVDTLFIDEGFGTLDAATLDVAIDALETLQAQGRKVGVISHVETMHQRIPVQIRVDKLGGGRSRVRVTGAGALLAAAE
ncbi:AAA family ATPase [Salinarimonas sp.]|uniref:AAA family ATPase n=1 Tax=Salinarimonas sp. TaxID=2766526 RepID=UPI0032D8D8B3